MGALNSIVRNPRGIPDLIITSKEAIKEEGEGTILHHTLIHTEEAGATRTMGEIPAIMEDINADTSLTGKPRVVGGTDRRDHRDTEPILPGMRTDIVNISLAFHY